MRGTLKIRGRSAEAIAIKIVNILEGLEEVRNRVPYQQERGTLSAAMEKEGEQLCEATRNGDIDKVKALIGSGADVSYFDSDGLTPLMHAAKLGHANLVKTLLEAGAPWNALSPSNLSAGDFAMDSGHQEVFEVLLNAG